MWTHTHTHSRWGVWYIQPKISSHKMLINKLMMSLPCFTRHFSFRKKKEMKWNNENSQNTATSTTIKDNCKLGRINQNFSEDKRKQPCDTHTHARIFIFARIQVLVLYFANHLFLRSFVNPILLLFFVLFYVFFSPLIHQFLCGNLCSRARVSAVCPLLYICACLCVRTLLSSVFL